jgi:intein/homing endonuclease
VARFFFKDSESVKNYFNLLKKHANSSWSSIAVELGFSSRQLRDWRSGKFSIPSKTVYLIKEKYGINIPSGIVIKEDGWHMKDAASKGGKRRYELYGNIGTLVGRRKGGQNSSKIHKINNTGFKLAKKILIPRKNLNLSEIIGAFIGDGGITKGQARIFLSLKKDRPYANHIESLIEKSFGIKAPDYERPYKSTIEIVISSVKLVRYLHKLGLPVGDKNNQGLDIPDWIQKKKSFQLSCLRGIFDTDGCTYIDSHKYKNKIYRNLGVAYTSYSPNLITSIVGILTNLGYNPTVKSKNRIFLRREKEIIRFFKEVNPANLRHQIVYNEFMEGYRSGHNGTASKAVV